MSKLFHNIERDNLHHAYLIEGNREDVVPEILKFIEELGFATSGNPDFSHQVFDTFKIEDARNLKEAGGLKSAPEGKKFFIIYANLFVLPAQNTLLKIFEEPKEDTHFFVVVPDVAIFIPTLISRFYLIKSSPGEDGHKKEAISFLSMSEGNRIEFMKSLLLKTKDEEEGENSARLRSMKFLNALEGALHDRKLPKSAQDKRVYEHIWKTREFVSEPGASIKSLMESLALIVPRL